MVLRVSRIRLGEIVAGLTHLSSNPRFEGTAAHAEQDRVPIVPAIFASGAHWRLRFRAQRAQR